MLIRCINIDGDSRLRLNDIYEINIKILNESSFSIINMPGRYSIDRFITLDNKPLKSTDYFYNKKYNPDFFSKDCAYVRPNTLRIKSLNDELYEIVDVVLGYSVSVPSGKTDKVYKKIKIKGSRKWFSAKNFYYYSKEEAQLILRDKILCKIIKTIDND